MVLPPAHCGRLLREVPDVRQEGGVAAVVRVQGGRHRGEDGHRGERPQALRHWARLGIEVGEVFSPPLSQWESIDNEIGLIIVAYILLAQEHR